MPASDVAVRRTQHLSTRQLEILEQMLRSAREEQAAELERHDPSAVGDNRDDGVAVIEREIALAYAERAREALTEIGAAAGRIQEGTYGHCEACGTEVPFERLEALPETRYCVACPRPTGVFG